MLEVYLVVTVVVFAIFVGLTIYYDKKQEKKYGLEPKAQQCSMVEQKETNVVSFFAHKKKSDASTIIADFLSAEDALAKDEVERYFKLKYKATEKAKKFLEEQEKLEANNNAG